MQSLFNNHYNPIIDQLNLDEIKFIVDLYGYITNVPPLKSYSFRSDNIIDMYILNNLIFNFFDESMQLYECAYNNNRLTFKLKHVNKLFNSNFIDYFVFTDSNKYLPLFLIDSLLYDGDIHFEYLVILHDILKTHIETTTELVGGYKQIANNAYADIDYDNDIGYVITTGYENPSFTLNEIINVININEILDIDKYEFSDPL